MNKNIFFSLIALSILSLNLFSQEKFETGYIINLQGDTIHGFIKNYNQARNPESIQFKEEINSLAKNVNPADIKKFSIGSNIYLSASVQINLSIAATDQLQMYFLRIIAEGPKSLYIFTDQSGTDQFYFKESNVFTLLIHKDHSDEENSASAVAKDQRYKGQLIIYFQDYPELKKDIESLTYNETSLTNLFRHYNSITKESTYILEKIKPTMHAGVIGGMGLTGLTTIKNEIGMNPDPVANGTYDSDFLPVGGAYFEIILPKTNAKWSLFAEFLYSTYHFKGGYSKTGVLNNYVDYLVDISIQQLLLDAGARYQINAGKLGIFLSGGFAYGLNFSSESTLNGTEHFYGKTIVLGETAAMGISNSEPGFFAGTGMRFKMLSLEVRYKHGFGITPNGGVPATTTNQLSIMLGISIL